MPKKQKKPPEEKNATMVELGRKGGRKGGPARRAALSPERRSEIAQIAANARWGYSPARGSGGSSSGI